MLYSVTASHYDCDVKHIILNHTIESLVKNDIDTCLLSISFNSEQHYFKYKSKIDHIKTLYGSKIEIYVHYSKLYQFQHLQYLCKIMSGFVMPTDKIFFCDDDDLLITLPPVHKYDTIAGFQYVLPYSETNPETFIDHEQFIKLLENHKPIAWKKINDFSGYVCKYEVFCNFFKIHKFDFSSRDKLDIFNFQLIDTKFMTFLDSAEPYIPPEPFIYHRYWSVWPERTIQQWIKNSSDFHSPVDLNSVSKTKYIIIGAGICITVAVIIKCILRSKS